MRRITAFIAILLVATMHLLAQAPQKFSYQAVVRNDAGAQLSNQYLEVEISILRQSEDGSGVDPVYSEKHTVKTTASGVVNLEIGGGQTMNDFSKIDWSNGPYYIQSTTEVGGKSVSLSSQLLSVPYALYSETAKKAESVDEAVLEKLIDARVRKIMAEMNVSGSDADGKLPGRFSVSSKKSVRFSKGNLQYQASTDTWRFAENQYDTMGENNLFASETYSGWIDLFGWGTSGYNDKHPWLLSRNNLDYGDGNKDITGTEYDWGIHNAISNGGNVQGIWHLMTQSEWDYLLSSRPNASMLKSEGKVCGISGYILLPDDFELPEGLSFKPRSLNNNIYTSKQWAEMEAAGAVFLPEVGARYFIGSRLEINSSSYHFNYWTSEYESSSAARKISSTTNRSEGHAVRLVTE